MLNLQLIADEKRKPENKMTMQTFILTAYDNFLRGDLSSMHYESDSFTSKETECFAFEMERLATEKSFDSVVYYECCGKKYWELSDGVTDVCIALYTEKCKIHIKLDYYDSNNY